VESGYTAEWECGSESEAPAAVAATTAATEMPNSCCQRHLMLDSPSWIQNPGGGCG